MGDPRGGRGEDACTQLACDLSPNSVCALAGRQEYAFKPPQQKGIDMEKLQKAKTAKQRQALGTSLPLASSVPD